MAIQLQLILSACAVYLGSTFVQPHNQMMDQAENDEIIVQENFQKLFNSIAKNDVKKSVLTQELKKNFDAMREELWFAQMNGNAQNKRNFHRTANENSVAIKRETKENNSGAGCITILIIGLGNPGEKYSQTRHNIGFVTVDELAKQYQTSFSEKKKFQCEMCTATKGKQKLIFVKPITYMNLSGKSVLAVMMYYNIPHKNIIVIHDDIDLKPGRIKIKIGGNSAGHNGLKSIDQAIGTKYTRIRIGIGKPENRQLVADYVLDNFSKSEYKVMKQAIDGVIINFDLVLDNRFEAFRNKIANTTKI